MSLLHHRPQCVGGRVCTSLGVKAAFKHMKTIRQTVMKLQTHILEERRRAVVYEVPYKDYGKTYLGQTKRTLKVRLGEHKQAVVRGDPKNDIAVHVHELHHVIDWVVNMVKRSVCGYWKENNRGHPHQSEQEDLEPEQRLTATNCMKPHTQSTLTITSTQVFHLYYALVH